MRDWQHVVNHIQKYGKRHKALYLLAVMMLFWGVFDGGGNGPSVI